MPTQLEVSREQEVDRLVRRFHRDSRTLSRLFLLGLDLDHPSLFGSLGEANRILDDLNDFVARWSRRNIVRLYDAQARSTQRQLKNLGLATQNRRNVSRLRDRSLEKLNTDPEVGFLALLLLATEEIRSRLQRIYRQSRALRSERRLGIAATNLVERSSESIGQELFSDLERTVSEQTLRPEFQNLGRDNIFSNLANLTYVSFPTINGERLVRIEDYAKQVGQAKTGQALTLGMRHTLLANERELVEIAPHKSSVGDACDLYAWRVFALTARAAKEWGVRLIQELPNGGYPFHPNCSHPEIPYFPEFKSAERIQRDMSQPPKWALNNTWTRVNREYKRRGGIEFLNRTHPNFRIQLTETGRKQLAGERQAEKRRMKQSQKSRS